MSLLIKEKSKEAQHQFISVIGGSIDSEFIVIVTLQSPASLTL